MKKYDVIIIGGGPAGLTAGIYCGRSGLKTLILEEDRVGGIANQSFYIGNYPGFPDGINGLDLMDKFYQQANKSQVDFIYESVSSIKEHLDQYHVNTNNEVYQSYGIIIATGGYPKKLEAVNEIEFIGKGISFCTICDAPEAKGKSVLVVGTGDTAVDQSIYLSKFTDKIVISSINDKGCFDCTDHYKLHTILKDKVSIIWNSEVVSFHGKEHLTKVVLRDKKSKELFDIPCEYCFEFIGFRPNSAICEDLLKIDEQGAIITNDRMETSRQGIYAIGDVRKKPMKQLTTATSDGAIAAYMVQKYIEVMIK